MVRLLSPRVGHYGERWSRSRHWGAGREAAHVLRILRPWCTIRTRRWDALSWAVVASLPFAPEIVLPSITAHAATRSPARADYAYVESYNPSFRSRRSTASVTSPAGRSWRSAAHYAINQGPVLVMIENYRSGFVWRLMRQCPYIATGLRRAGFQGGWLTV